MSLKSLAPEKDPVERNKTKNSSFAEKPPEKVVFLHGIFDKVTVLIV